MLSTISNTNECILLWYGEDKALDLFSKLSSIPNHFFIFNNINKKTIWFDFFKVMQLKNKFIKINNQFPNINQIYSSYNYGIYFELIKKIFKVKNKNIILFDDGISSLIKIKNRNRLLKSLIYLLHGIFIFISKYRLFYDKKYLLIKSIFFKKNQIKYKLIENISVNVKNYY
jgi:hypothetical protein